MVKEQYGRGGRFGLFEVREETAFCDAMSLAYDIVAVDLEDRQCRKLRGAGEDLPV